MAAIAMAPIAMAPVATARLLVTIGSKNCRLGKSCESCRRMIGLQTSGRDLNRSPPEKPRRPEPRPPWLASLRNVSR